MKKFLILLLAIFLSGCVHTPTADYAPTKKVDVSKIPNAKPQKLPKSKYGNPSTYKVLGKTYHVLNSSKDFDETGVASWYGMKFAGHTTATRDIYDPFEMTAANKTLPLPTFAKVTNLRNGKWIIVKINDRGPFVGDRLIDLSYVAARKLDLFQKGTCLVRVQSIDSSLMSEESETGKSPLIDLKSRIYLQTGVFANETNAKRMVNQIHEITDEPCRIYSNYLNGKTLYRVKIGPIAETKTSTAIASQLEAAGLPKPIEIKNYS